MKCDYEGKQLIKKSKQIMACSLFAALIAFNTLKANAFGNNNYDENVVRAYDTAKIVTFKPHITIDKDDDLNLTLKEYLTKRDFFKKNKLKNKEAIFLVKEEDNDDSITINKVYWLKNPEKYLFSLDKSTSKEILLNRELIKANLDNDLSKYAILSQKIEAKDRLLATKVVSGGYNGFLDLVVLTPKMGFGGIINPPFRWMKTNNPKNIYNSVTSEMEQLAVGDKEFLKIVCIKK